MDGAGLQRSAQFLDQRESWKERVIGERKPTANMRPQTSHANVPGVPHRMSDPYSRITQVEYLSSQLEEISELSYNRQPPLPSIVSLQPVVLDRAADQKAGKLGANNVIDDINTALDQLECTYQPVHQQQHAAFEQLEALALARVRSQEPKPRPTAPAPAPAPSRPLAAPAVPLEPRVQSGPLRGPLLLSVANMQDTEQRVQQLLELALRTSGNKTARPVLWYYSHFWGRSEIVRMTLVMAGIDFIFAGFNNAEAKMLKPQLAANGINVDSGFPMLQIDGLNLALEIPIVRYIAQRAGLYPQELAEIHGVEAIIVRAEELFAMMIKLHYKKFNTTGGGKAAYTAADEAAYANTVSKSVLGTFQYFQAMLLTFAGRYLVGDSLTIADVIVCHYRYMLGQGEFAQLTAALFGADELAVFERYYSAMLELHFEAYFATRFGAQGDAQAMHARELVAHEGTGGTWYPIALTWPFTW